LNKKQFNREYKIKEGEIKDYIEHHEPDLLKKTETTFTCNRCGFEDQYESENEPTECPFCEKGTMIKYVPEKK